MAQDEQLTFIVADLSRFTAKETIALALDIQANLQEDTPRHTGWARANWVMSLRAPLEDASVVASSKPTPAMVSQAQVRQSRSIEDVAGYSSTSLGPIFTTNNVPYIGALNNGHSPQAGAAFIQRSVGRALMEREANP